MEQAPKQENESASTEAKENTTTPAPAEKTPTETPLLSGREDAPRIAPKKQFRLPGKHTKSLIAAAVVILVVVGLLYAKSYGIPAPVASLLHLHTGSVATVNGVDITRDSYNQSLSNLTNAAKQQGADPADPQIKSLLEKQALDNLINNEVLLQGAKQAGITADPDKVQTQYSTIEQSVGGADALASRLKELGITKEQVLSDIGEQLMINDYITANVDIQSITVSDQDVQDYYDQISTGATDTPALDDIRPQIEAQLKSQKQQDAVNAFIESLKSKADLKTYI